MDKVPATIYTGAAPAFRSAPAPRGARKGNWSARWKARSTEASPTANMCHLPHVSLSNSNRRGGETQRAPMEITSFPRKLPESLKETERKRRSPNGAHPHRLKCDMLRQHRSLTLRWVCAPTPPNLFKVGPNNFNNDE